MILNTECFLLHSAVGMKGVSTFKSIEEKGVDDFILDKEENREWIKLLGTEQGKF